MNQIKKQLKQIYSFFKKHSFLNVLLLCILLLILGLTIDHWQQLFPKQETFKELEEVDALEYSELSQDQLKGYFDLYQDPYVLAVRDQLNDYLNNQEQNLDAIALASLGQYAQYYQSKFIVLNINRSPMGGKEMTLIFQSKPDKIFLAHVNQDQEERYLLRDFRAMEMTNKDILLITKQYQNFLNDKEHSL